jgi:hypothetical protein
MESGWSDVTNYETNSKYRAVIWLYVFFLSGFLVVIDISRTATRVLLKSEQAQ